MRLRTFVLAGVVVLAAGCGGGPKALPPLRDDTPTTGRAVWNDAASTSTTTAPEAAPTAAVRAELAQLLAVPDPRGFRLDTAAVDRDPDTLSPALADQFAGAGFVHGMVRTWFDSGGRRLTLAVYAFEDAAGARQAWSCGCPGPPLAGVPDSSVVTFDDGVGAAAAVGRFVVRSNSDVPGWLGGTGTVETLLREARARILAAPGAGAV